MKLGHAAALLSAALLPASCSVALAPPKTTCFDTKKLDAAKREPITIVSFAASPELATSGGSPGYYRGKQGDDLTNRLALDQFRSMRDGLSKTFRLVGHSKVDDLRSRIKPEDRDRVAAAIEEAKAEFGIIVWTQFGWDWQTMKTGVNYYRFNTVTTIHDKEGRIVWEAALRCVPDRTIGGKRTLLPNADEFLSGFAAQAPSVQTIARHYSTAFSNYPRYLLALIDDDLAGKPHRHPFDCIAKAGFYAHDLEQRERPSD